MSLSFRRYRVMDWSCFKSVVRIKIDHLNQAHGGDYKVAYIQVCCPECHRAEVIKHGKTAQGKQRYRCTHSDCKTNTFLLSKSYSYKGCRRDMNGKIISHTLRASGIRDIAITLEISCGKVIDTIKRQAGNLKKVNWGRIPKNAFALMMHIDAQLDEQWSFVRNKKNQRWLWVAICQYTGQILAFTFGKRTNECCHRLKKMLRPFNIRYYQTDDWQSYRAEIEAGKHKVGKCFTQKVERLFLTLRTHIKRLTRKTICFSKSELMHDTIIGLYINKNFF